MISTQVEKSQQMGLDRIKINIRKIKKCDKINMKKFVHFVKKMARFLLYYD